MSNIYTENINNELSLINNINYSNIELMNTRLVKKDYYNKDDLTGLAKLCDWFIHNNKIINITTTHEPKLIFITALSGDINVEYFISNVMNNIKNKFNLIIASEDYTFPTGTGDVRHNFYIKLQDKIFNNLFKYPHINKIFVENLDTICEKTIPIPLGILPHSINFYNDLINYVPKNMNNRQCLLFNCNRIRNEPQFNYRTIIHNLCITKLKHFSKSLSNEITESEFKNHLLNSKFTLCVRGGGLDLSPKFWQCILCGTIPIIKHSVLDNMYNRFPVVFVDDFNEHTLSIEKLNEYFNVLKPYYEDINNRLKVLEILKMNYWFKFMKL